MVGKIKILFCWNNELMRMGGSSGEWGYRVSSSNAVQCSNPVDSRYEEGSREVDLFVCVRVNTNSTKEEKFPFSC